MIIAFLLEALLGFLNFLLSFLPTGELPTQISTALTYIMGTMATFNWLLPIDTLLTVAVLAIAVHAAILTFHFAEWVYHKVRG